MRETTVPEKNAGRQFKIETRLPETTENIRRVIKALKCGAGETIRSMMEGLLDSAAVELFGVPFDMLTTSEARQVAGIVGSYAIAAGKASKPIPYKVAEAAHA